MPRCLVGARWFGAALPLLLAIVIHYALPESPRFLALNDHRSRHIGAVMAKLAPGVRVEKLWEPISKSLVPASEQGQSHGDASIGALFEKPFATPTTMLSRPPW